jgi:hypothetical protein
MPSSTKAVDAEVVTVRPAALNESAAVVGGSASTTPLNSVWL